MFANFVRYLILAGRMDEAILLLGRLNAFTGKEKRLGSRIEILCLTAITYEKKNDRPRAMESLNEALTLGMEEGYARTFLDEGGTHGRPAAQIPALGRLPEIAGETGIRQAPSSGHQRHGKNTGRRHAGKFGVCPDPY